MASVSRKSFLCLLAGCFALLQSGPVAAVSPRFTAELMVRNENLGEVRFSADGSRVYFDRHLPFRDRADSSRDFTWGRDLSQLAVARAADGQVEEIARGPQDRTWLIGESPGGSHLAFGWFDQAGVARLGLRDLRSGVETRRDETLSFYSFCAYECPVWLSDRHLLVVSQSPEEQLASTAITSTNFRRVAALSEQTWRGKAPSVRAVGSGRFQGASAEVPHQFWLVDAGSGRAEKIDEAVQLHSGSPVVAPHGGRVAYLRRTGRFDQTRLPQSMGLAAAADSAGLAVFDLERGLQTVPVCADCSVNPRALRWSPQGRQLYFTARYVDGSAIAHRQYIYDAVSGALSSFEVHGVPFAVEADLANGLWSAPVLWLDEAHLAVRTRRAGAGEFEAQDYRWHLVDRSGRVLRELGAGLPRGQDKQALRRPVAAYRGGLLLPAGGDLWLLPQHGEPRNLTAAIDEAVSPWCPGFTSYGSNLHPCDALRQEFTTYPSREPDALDEGVIALRLLDAQGASTGEFALLDLDTGDVSRLRRPDADSEPLAISPRTQAGVFRRKGVDGDALLLVDRQGRTRVLHRFNAHLAGVRAARAIHLVRREPGEDEDRHDWLLLPPDHQPGQRHPLLVYFYPDTRYGPELTSDDLRDISFLNMNIPASHGYAVLLASMKISSAGDYASNPMTQMHGQLIRAAENAVAKGYVDPERWAIMGQSYGGYGTLGVLTQTDRFKAAISSAAPVNLTSMYAAMGLHVSSASYVPEGYSAPLVEGGQLRMGGPPWVNPQRYLDNSPLFSADRIVTPLMLVQGDLDYVNVNEGEQMFSALLRQNKDAVFVRYWGEYHSLQSPANIVDFWQRAFAFLDAHLGTGQARSVPAAAADGARH